MATIEEARIKLAEKRRTAYLPEEPKAAPVVELSPEQIARANEVIAVSDGEKLAAAQREVIAREEAVAAEKAKIQAESAKLAEYVNEYNATVESQKSLRASAQKHLDGLLRDLYTLERLAEKQQELGRRTDQYQGRPFRKSEVVSVAFQIGAQSPGARAELASGIYFDGAAQKLTDII